MPCDPEFMICSLNLTLLVLVRSLVLNLLCPVTTSHNMVPLVVMLVNSMQRQGILMRMNRDNRLVMIVKTLIIKAMFVSAVLIVRERKLITRVHKEALLISSMVIYWLPLVNHLTVFHPLMWFRHFCSTV